MNVEGLKWKVKNPFSPFPESLSQTGFPGNSVVKNPPASAGDTGLITGLGRSPGGGNGNPLQYFCLENPMDRGAWRATAHGVAKESDTTEQLSTNIHAHNLSKIVIVNRIVQMHAYLLIHEKYLDTEIWISFPLSKS